MPKGRAPRRRARSRLHGVPADANPVPAEPGPRNPGGSGRQRRAKSQVQDPDGEPRIGVGQLLPDGHKVAAAEKHFLLALAAAPQDLAVIRAVADFDVSIGKLVAAEQLRSRSMTARCRASPKTWLRSNRQLAEIYITRGGYVNFVKRSSSTRTSKVRKKRPATAGPAALVPPRSRSPEAGQGGRHSR